MITEIGIVAGEIWNHLDKCGETDLDNLASGINRSQQLILMSLGWLAREGHVLIRGEGPQYTVSLRKKEGAE